MKSVLIEPYLLKAIELLHSKAENSPKQLKCMLDEAFLLQSKHNNNQHLSVSIHKKIIIYISWFPLSMRVIIIWLNTQDFGLSKTRYIFQKNTDTSVILKKVVNTTTENSFETCQQQQQLVSLPPVFPNLNRLFIL